MPGSKRAQWGWYYLNKQWATAIVRNSRITSRDLVLDIGAGSGALTSPLAGTGARIIAIELHEERAALLRGRFGNVPSVKVVRADARDLWLPTRPFKVVANPPFAITADVVRRLLHPRSQLVCAHLVLQWQVARRLQTGDVPHGAHRQFDFEVAQRLPRGAFTPRPKVDAAVLHIHRKGEKHER